MDEEGPEATTPPTLGDTKHDQVDGPEIRLNEELADSNDANIEAQDGETDFSEISITLSLPRAACFGAPIRGNIPAPPHCPQFHPCC